MSKLLKPSLYLKAILAALSTFFFTLANVADGGLTAKEVLVAVGGLMASLAIVYAAPNGSTRKGQGGQSTLLIILLVVVALALGGLGFLAHLIWIILVVYVIVAIFTLIARR